MLAFSNDYYGFIFRATQSVELFCAYQKGAIFYQKHKLFYTTLSLAYRFAPVLYRYGLSTVYGLFVMPFILWLSSTYLFQTSSLISINSLMQRLKFSEKHLHYKFPYQKFLFYYHCYQTKYILYNFHTHPSVCQQ